MVTTGSTLTSDIVSTISTPSVHYAASYTAARVTLNDAAVSVKMDFTAWLNANKSILDTGVKLTVFARINGDVWRTAVLKKLTDYWKDTTRHTVSLTLSADTTDEAADIEFYISRTGSRHSGSAGILGSAANPLRYTVSLPAYTPGKVVTPTPSTVDAAHYACVNIGGAWKKAIPYVRIAGTWEQAVPYVRVNGVWKST